MSLDVFNAHANLLERLLHQMETTFTTALAHPSLSDTDQEVAAEMLQWIRHGLFLCQQVHELKDDHGDQSQSPVIVAMYVLNDQVSQVSEELRKKDLFRPGAADRVQKMLDALPPTH